MPSLSSCPIPIQYISLSPFLTLLVVSFLGLAQSFPAALLVLSTYVYIHRNYSILVTTVVQSDGRGVGGGLGNLSRLS